MVREALAVGLYRDDAIIRRRLQQKVGVRSEEVVASGQPSDAELVQYIAAHADVFRTEPTATFTRIHLDPSKRVAALQADAKHLLDALRGTHLPDPAQAGDRLLLLEPRYGNTSRAEVARLFGADFASAPVKQPVGQSSV